MGGGWNEPTFYYWPLFIIVAQKAHKTTLTYGYKLQQINISCYQSAMYDCIFWSDLKFYGFERLMIKAICFYY